MIEFLLSAFHDAFRFAHDGFLLSSAREIFRLFHWALAREIFRPFHRAAFPISAF